MNDDDIKRDLDRAYRDGDADTLNEMLGLGDYDERQSNNNLP